VIEHRAVALVLPGRRRRASLSLVPLIDITFILLIFFVLLIQLGQNRSAGVTFSSAQFNALAEPGSEETGGGVKPLTVTLSADGTIHLWDRRRIAISDLAGILQERVLSIVLSGTSTPPIVIEPEPDVPLQVLARVMSIAQANAFFKTHVAMPKLAAEVFDK
jgi:biopolymer transport protein ExbD